MRGNLRPRRSCNKSRWVKTSNNKVRITPISKHPRKRKRRAENEHNLQPAPNSISPKPFSCLLHLSCSNQQSGHTYIKTHPITSSIVGANPCGRPVRMWSPCQDVVALSGCSRPTSPQSPFNAKTTSHKMSNSDVCYSTPKAMHCLLNMAPDSQTFPFPPPQKE